MKDKHSERVGLERKIIASLISDVSLIDCLDVDLGYFQPKHREIIKAIIETQSGDPTILAGKTTTVGIDELRDITGDVLYTTEQDFDSYVDELKRLIENERLENQLNALVIKMRGGVDAKDIYEELGNLKLEGYKEEKDGEVLYRLLQQVSGELEVKIISTGYRDLDALVGGYEKGQVIVIGARPGVGKSMFAINLANKNILAGERVALFSLEMKKEQVYRRLLAMNSGVSVWRLKQKADADIVERIGKGFERLNSQLENIKVFDDLHKIGEIERRIRQVVRVYGVSVVYLDYLQLIKNPDIKNNPIESLTDISQRFKQLALELGITIVELSQLNRESDKTMIKKASQLRGSGSIEQDADMVWILDKLDADTNKLEVSVQKCRDGRLGDISLIQNSDIMLITDLPNKPF